MGNLQVYYCPSCGFYGYYDRPNVCLRCSTGMIKLKSYDYKECDFYSRNADTAASCPCCGKNMRLIGQTAQIDTLLLKIVQLEEENGKLTDTVDWMHDMIWDLIKKSKGLEP